MRIIQLTEIIPILKKIIGKNPLFLKELEQRDWRSAKLYRLISDQGLRDVIEIKKAMGLSPTSFKATVGRLEKVVNDVAIKLDISIYEKNRHQASLLEFYRKIGLLKTYIALGARSSAEQMAKKILRAGQSFGHPFLIFVASEALCNLVAESEEREKDYFHWKGLHYKANEALSAEQAVRSYVQEARLHYLSNRLPKSKVSAIIRKQLDELSGYFGNINSEIFDAEYLKGKVQMHFSAMEYEEALHTVEYAIEYFKTKPNAGDDKLTAFLLLKLSCCTVLGRFEEADQVAAQASSMIEEGTQNWYQLLIYHIYMHLHLGNYKHAAELYSNANNKSALSNLDSEFLRSYWRLLGVYVYIALVCSNEPLEQYNLPRVRSNKLMNDIPFFTRDKRGMNVAIQIAIVVLMILENRFDDIDNKSGALEKYSARYLRKSDALFRPNAFLKILSLLPKANFRHEAFTRQSKPYLELLERTPIEMYRQSHQIEIIPYKELWEMIVGNLKKGRRSRSGQA
jgi:hypothetical protein